MSIEMVDVNIAAEITGLKPSTIRKYAREQKIPHYKFGGGQKARYRFIPEEIIEWVKAHRVVVLQNKNSPRSQRKELDINSFAVSL
jgi:excisionase family DNA binding protein